MDFLGLGFGAMLCADYVQCVVCNKLCLYEVVKRHRLADLFFLWNLQNNKK